MKLHQLASLVSVLVATTIIGGCGGGGGSEPETSSPSDPSSPETPVESSASLTGVFIDSPVEGLPYTTSSGEKGSTNALGEFSYNDDDMISFTLAGIQFPEVEASGVLTPFDLVSNFNTRNPTTSNLLRLLQSLDDDGDISQTISLDTDKINSIQQAGLSYQDLTLSALEFEDLLTSHALFGLPDESALISANQAFEHFEKTLSESKIIDTDNDGIPNATDPDDDNDGIEDSRDHFAWDKDESQDFDLDFIGDNADTDDDNDGVLDTEDTEANFAFTATSLESGFTFTAFDSSTGRLFATDYQRQQLKAFSLSSAKEISVVEFDEKPSYLFFEPTSKRIYISLHSPGNRHSGSIAVVDPDTFEIINVFDVDIQPGEIAAREDGLVVVNSGSSARTNLYNAENGELVDSESSVFGGTIAISKDGNWLYIGDSGGSDRTLDKYALSASGITPAGSYVARDKEAIADKIWLSPDGSFVITKAGVILDTEDLSVLGSLPDVVFINDIHFDEERDFIYVTKFGGSILVVNAKSLSVVPDSEIDGIYEKTFTVDDLIYLVDIDYLNEQLTINKFTHPCLDCVDNQKPVAQFAYSPENGTTRDEYTFDASDSYDPDANQTLLYRWDLGGDGNWETEYSSSPEFKHSFLTATTETIVLQVIDNFGLTDTKKIVIEVMSGVDTGVEITNSTANQLDFSPAHIIADPQRNRAYLSDKEGKRLYVINPITGMSERYFEFDYMPERMALSPDGSQLYVALLTQEHDQYWHEEDQAGFITTFDLEQLARVNIFEVPVDPFDIVATSYDRLVVSTGSGQYGSIFLLDASTGETISNSYIAERAKLSVSKNESYIFATDAQKRDVGIQIFSLNETSILNIGSFGYSGNYPDAAETWVSPDGVYLITSKGDIYNINETELFAELGVEAKHISFDAEQNTFSLVSPEGTVNYYNLSTFQPVAVLNDANAEFATFFRDQVLVVEQSVDGSTSFGVTAHPCLNCAPNTAPVADYSYSPTAGTVEDTFVFDASPSSDVEDQESLLYRWDVGSDGTWETELSNQKTFNHVFSSTGNFSVTLEVMDPSGLSSTRTIDLVVRDLPDLGVLVEDSQSFQIDFNITDFEIDATRNKAYFSDIEAKRLYVVDLQTGSTEKYFEFDQMPERMALSPDGKTLYLALLTQQHSSYWWEADQNGFIAIFDLEQMAKVHTYEVKTDPFDLVVNQQGKLIVTSGSGQWTDIYALDGLSGKVLGSASIRQRSHLSLHPSGDYVFAADTDLSPSDFEKFDISGEAIVSLGDSPYHGSYNIGGKVWVYPNGDFLISAGGDIFLTSDMTHYAKLPNTSGEIVDVAFDTANNALFVLKSDGSIQLYNFESNGFIQNLSINEVDLLAFTNGQLLTLSAVDSTLYFAENPCADCGANTPPTAGLTYSSTSDTTNSLFTFDASSSTDNEDGHSLLYRWDIDNDGQWDTQYNTDALLERRYSTAGSKTIILEVKDSSGSTDVTSITVDVLFENDFGVQFSEAHLPYELPFKSTAIQYDDIHNIAYISDFLAKKLYLVNMQTGLTEKYFEFEHKPERMALSPDGQTLFVSLVTENHSSYWWNEEQSGYIAVFDTAQQAKINTYVIPIDPYDLVVNQHGKLIVSSGSGQWTSIYAFDSLSGSLLGSSSIRQRSRLSLHPDGEIVFAADTDLSPSDFEKFDISGEGISYIGQLSYHGDYNIAGNVWVLPNGENVLARGGFLFTAETMTFVQSLFEQTEFILDLSFNSDNLNAYMLTTNSYASTPYQLYEFNLESFELTNATEANSAGKLINTPSSLFGAVDNEDGTTSLITFTFD
ncbi:PKD domain-containing protein [Enterovibrio sp. ZSDZ42]|uniref:PKD domain-containing protein n=1 Tax=Enterovibrio gelatinilyticus TaxID=2899819 RepID=A0ABT5QYC7_9GAMM|nr:PKD domain-containing protein [Enterovibrio sp. ZSDZ42]MDD1793022.1 PKD domain-containing protein [Enterovibrio sp. ZSDZ42]